MSTKRDGEKDDDSLFEIGRKKRKEAKRNPPKGPQVTPGSACCGTCSNWDAPGRHDDYGSCRELVSVGSGDNARIMVYDSARSGFFDGFMLLPTAGGFRACNLYDGDGVVMPVDRTGDEYPVLDVRTLHDLIRERT